jgi:hypothetical protein
MCEFGDVRYSREVRGTVWTQFREGGAAQAALNAHMIAAGAIDWEVTESLRQSFGFIGRLLPPMFHLLLVVVKV